MYLEKNTPTRVSLISKNCIGIILYFLLFFIDIDLTDHRLIDFTFNNNGKIREHPMFVVISLKLFEQKIKSIDLNNIYSVFSMLIIVVSKNLET